MKERSFEEKHNTQGKVRYNYRANRDSVYPKPLKNKLEKEGKSTWSAAYDDTAIEEDAILFEENYNKVTS
jgi:hypothetical protein